MTQPHQPPGDLIIGAHLAGEIAEPGPTRAARPVGPQVAPSRNQFRAGRRRRRIRRRLSLALIIGGAVLVITGLVFPGADPAGTPGPTEVRSETLERPTTTLTPGPETTLANVPTLPPTLLPPVSMTAPSDSKPLVSVK